MKLLDTVEIIKNITNHPYQIGDTVRIYRIFEDGTFDVFNFKGECWRLKKEEVSEKTENMLKNKAKVVLDTAKRLCKSQNKVTTLEIKAEVRRLHPNEEWNQDFISKVMMTGTSIFDHYDTITGNKLHRVYSLKNTSINTKNKDSKMAQTKTAVKKAATKGSSSTKTISRNPSQTRISRSKALEMMENSKGHFFTATFVSKKGERTINCQYLKDQSRSKLGFVKVKEAIKAKLDPKDAIRQINLQTISRLSIAGNSYKIS